MLKLFVPYNLNHFHRMAMVLYLSVCVCVCVFVCVCGPYKEPGVEYINAVAARPAKSNTRHSQSTVQCNSFRGPCSCAADHSPGHTAF